MMLGLLHNMANPCRLKYVELNRYAVVLRSTVFPFSHILTLPQLT